MCNKVGYPSREEARRDARMIRVARRRYNKRLCNNPKSGRRMRPYMCSYCGLWHLTTQKPRNK